MYRIHVSVIRCKCHNLNLRLRVSLEGCSFHSGNIFTQIKRKFTEHISITVYVTSHGSSDFFSQKEMDGCPGISCRFQQFFSHDMTME